MGIQPTLGKGRVADKVWTRDIEHEAMHQRYNVAERPIAHGPIAAMPAMHASRPPRCEPHVRALRKMAALPSLHLLEL